MSTSIIFPSIKNRVHGHVPVNKPIPVSIFQLTIDAQGRILSFRALLARSEQYCTILLFSELSIDIEIRS